MNANKLIEILRILDKDNECGELIEELDESFAE